MSENDESTPNIKVDKKKKSVSVDLYTKGEPIRSAVSEIVFADDVTEEELTYVQNELRRLSRVVKKARTTIASTEA